MIITRHIQALLLAFTLLLSLPTFADTIEGLIVGISDGDTLTLLGISKAQIKIRLAAIDAPEKAMSFGQRSKEKLSDICYGKQAAMVDTLNTSFPILNHAVT